MCTLGQYAEPGLVVEIAEAAESAGWEAVFVWDHLAFAWGTPSADPWVVLAAVAQTTSWVKLGTAVTPLARRRPVVLANEVASRLDEALELVTALWSGQPVTHHGRHYRVEGVSLAPLPVQRPRPPIWIGGDDVALIGVSRGPDDPVLGSYATVGATWWLEHNHGQRATHPDLLARITAGPPS